MSDAAPLVVGVIFPAKKIARLQEVLDEEADGVRFVLIDLEAAAEGCTTEEELRKAATSLASRYGPLDALLHKLAHDMVFSELGDEAATAREKLVQSYLAQYPTVRVVDPLDSVRLLTDRHAACRMLRSLQEEQTLQLQLFKVPAFHVVENAAQFHQLMAELDAGRTRLPLICKSVEACGA
jgi:hypothetical protein